MDAVIQGPVEDGASPGQRVRRGLIHRKRTNDEIWNGLSWGIAFISVRNRARTQNRRTRMLQWETWILRRLV